MGGPSVDFYRAAEAARKKRLAAMRTRDGVVDLAEWHAARRAADVLESTLPPERRERRPVRIVVRNPDRSAPAVSAPSVPSEP